MIRNFSAEDEVYSRPAPWLNEICPESDVVISSRVALSRNLDQLTFPPNSDALQLTSVRDSVTAALMRAVPDAESEFLEFRMHELSELERGLLRELKFISPHTGADAGRALLLHRDLKEAIRINDENHFRIQELDGGLRLEILWRRADALDDLLEQELPCAFDSTLGYLTSDPGKAGTGLRASVMLHLPGLIFMNQGKQFLSALDKLRIDVTGYNGDREEMPGHLFLLVNRNTLGESESEIIARISSVAAQLAASERAARKRLLDKERDLLADYVFRALGLLKSARLISTGEAMSALLALRLGVSIGLIHTVTLREINLLLLQIQPSQLRRIADGEDLQPRARAVLRASLLRKTFEAK